MSLASRIAILALAAVAGLASPLLAQTAPLPASPSPSTIPATTPSPSIAPHVQASELIDLNTASKIDLMTLDEIGEARSDAIIKGRPYRAKNELVDKKIVSEWVYEKIKDRVIARHATAAEPAAPARK